MARPDDLGVMPKEEFEDLQTYLDRFETAWKDALQHNHAPPEIANCLPPLQSPFRVEVLHEFVKADLEYRWNLGQTPDLESYLKEHRDLGTSETVSPQLIFEEYHNRVKHGVQVKMEDYQRRFPVQLDEFKKLVDSQSSSQPTPNSPVVATDAFLPTPGPRVEAKTGPGIMKAEAYGAKVRDYEMLEILGQGSFGEVWKARTLGSGIEVAVKALFKPISTGEAQRELESLELIKALRHPFLLQLQNFFIEDRKLYVVMELATAGNLKTRLQECKKQGLPAIPVDELLKYYENLAEALDYLHSEKIQHRDIKPENILLVGQNPSYAKLADFGLAKQMSGTHSETQAFGGTPAYQAPEMFRGKVRNRKSDQYSFAYTYAELRIGKMPFDCASLPQCRRAHQHLTPNLDPLDIPEQKVLLRALAKNPSERFATCAEFVRKLKRAVRFSEKRQKRRGDATVAFPKKPKAASKPPADSEAPSASSSALLEDPGHSSEPGHSSLEAGSLWYPGQGTASQEGRQACPPWCQRSGPTVVPAGHIN